MREIIYKVPGGKLLRVKAEVKDGRFKDVKIHGDFFIHPESAIADIEQAVLNKGIEEAKTSLESVTKDIQMIGISCSDIVQSLEKLIKGNNSS